MRAFVISFFFVFSTIQVFSQPRTVGYISSTFDVFEGYTLLSPLQGLDYRTFLIDNCGDVVHVWPGNQSIGLSSYLLPDGSLLRAGSEFNPQFPAGGNGGKVQIWDWNGNLTWDYKVSDSTFVSHHDIEYMPNGNILILVWDSKDSLECISQGRDPAILFDGELWSEKVIEVTPIGPTTGTVVWEWDSWDHIIQNYDSLKANYGDPSSFPERFNVNYTGLGAGGQDWLHANALGYNPSRDEVIFSSRLMNEVYVIDHSTTTLEASGHTGGARGKGGDILYRWGNPEAYSRGDSTDRRLYGQHDAHFIPDSMVSGVKIMVFNNGQGRLDGDYSSVDIISPPIDFSGGYAVPNPTYGPDTAEWSYTAPNPTDFYGKFISGARYLPNGNVIICNGTYGTLFEVDSMKNEVWRYINPVANGGILNQGNTIPVNPVHGTSNWVFKVQKYATGYSGIVGPLVNTGPIELNPWPYICTTGLHSIAGTQINFEVYPNPTAGDLTIKSSENNNEPINLRIYDITGRVVLNDHFSYSLDGTEFNISEEPQGIYIVELNGKDFSKTFKLVKQ